VETYRQKAKEVTEIYHDYEKSSRKSKATNEPFKISRKNNKDEQRTEAIKKVQTRNRVYIKK
jgi:hypothetical protein